MTEQAAVLLLAKFEAALAVVRETGPLTVMGLFGFLGSVRADMADVAECHEVVIEMAADADAVREIECLTGENLRDQITVEELETIAEEAAYCRRWWAWN